MRISMMLALRGIALCGTLVPASVGAQHCTAHKGNELRCALEKSHSKRTTSAYAVVQPAPLAGGGGTADAYGSQCGLPGTRMGSTYLDAGVAQRTLVGGAMMINIETVRQCFELFVTNCARGSEPARCVDIFPPGSLRLEVE